MCAALVLQGASDYKKPDKNLNRIENEGHLEPASDVNRYLFLYQFASVDGPWRRGPSLSCRI